AFKNSQPGSLLKTAIMGKTADLTAVQKAIIDTLKQEVLYQGTSVGSLWEGKSVAENAAQREE
ncbi:hypothetical protein M9458_026800, partial [Cirrhinus mrigala]